MKFTAAILILCTIYLSGCSFSEKTWHNDILSIEGPDKKAIKITETVTRAAWPVGTYQAQLELHFYDGSQWQQVDKSFKRTPVYSKLYTKEDRFVQLSDPLIYYENLEGKETLSRIGIKEAKDRKFPIGGTYKTGYVWDVFVSPDDISPADYQIALSLLRDNLEEICRKIRRPRSPKDQGEDIGRYPTITSIVYREYDYEPWVGIQHNVDVHFKTEVSNLFISQAPPNQAILVLSEASEASMSKDRVIFRTSNIGFITDDQEHILIRKPSFNPEMEELVGSDWLDFYKSCLNSEGYNIFHYYTPIPWERKDETK